MSLISRRLSCLPALAALRGIEQAFRTAFERIKPIDGIYMGMFPRVKDEIRENAGIVSRILTRA